MEMRSLTRSLRARPTSLYTAQQPSSILRSQFFAGHRSLRFSFSDNAPPTNAPRGPRASQPSDFDQILDKLNLDSQAPNSQSPYSSSSPSSPQRPGADGISVTSAVGAAISPTGAGPDRPLRKVSMKLGPSLGRQVPVEPERGLDLTASLRILHRACQQNRVRQDAQAQRFHVRRGQMKKNKRIVRWRRLFKYSFNHTVDRINRMRAQGW
ncbi:hypothetical protein P170DRAFT_437819 [Aspergillus steynii IBT 23096]|uniref:Ribosomal protein S21 n=1 Tax=Aspergillus steynii IBT 23096 TaxID=1392250 RepID=A0A2I2G5F9_9EURO|nr:uncharacterized protein P170DRAFT_437819 [Aspergillus steynii IBT 23096]PLB48110.1 hypothetical protein P170DRAFT_437819 [Aspergillus steynii IBT 23096]